MDRPEHDKALIYTTGFVKRNYFCILDFFSGEAHSMANNADIMLELAARADKFRSIY